MWSLNNCLYFFSNLSVTPPTAPWCAPAGSVSSSGADGTVDMVVLANPYDIHFLVSKLCTGLYFFEPECSTTTRCTCRRRRCRHCRRGSFSRPFDIHFLGLLWQLAWHEINFFCQAVFKSPPFFAHQFTLGLVHHTSTQYADLMFKWQFCVHTSTGLYENLHLNKVMNNFWQTPKYWLLRSMFKKHSNMWLSTDYGHPMKA